MAGLELYALMSLALVAGVVSFTSPCCLPMLPGYVSYVSGLREPAPSAGGTVATRVRTRVMTGSVLFVIGFTLVFTVLGITASGENLLSGFVFDLGEFANFGREILTDDEGELFKIPLSDGAGGEEDPHSLPRFRDLLPKFRDACQDL